MNGSSRVSVFLAYLTFIFCSRLSIRLSLFVAVGSLNEKLSVFLFDSSPLEDLWSSGRSKINKNRFLYGYFPLNMEGENSSKNVFFNVVRLFCLFVCLQGKGPFFPRSKPLVFTTRTAPSKQFLACPVVSAPDSSPSAPRATSQPPTTAVRSAPEEKERKTKQDDLFHLFPPV